MNYRPQIDGLRAVAVVPVILFHAGFTSFRGGFVGVDVFFVISGYLITTIILAELEQGRFSLVGFYERRARRILPALFLVTLTCVPIAWFWLLPGDMKDFSQSLIAVSALASNILFWVESGYFDAASETKPLLHTWSLAVEEQYYLLFPPFLMLLWRLGKRWILVSLGLLFITSLAVAQWAVSARLAAAFYLLPTRGWELLMGAFAAFYLSHPHRKECSKGLSEVGGWLGVALILYAVFAFSNATPFPGLYAVVPTLGTVLIILFATQRTTVGSLFGNKVFVGVGLISYSAYLWHQPLFAFARQKSLLEPGPIVLGVLSCVSFVLAYFTWRYVETPFRRKDYCSRARIFSYALIGSLLFISCGAIGILTDGVILGRNNARQFVDLHKRMMSNYGLSAECEGDYNESLDCRTNDAPEVLLWGDSFAMHLAQGLLASNPQIKLVQKTVSECGPFLDIATAPQTRLWSEKCLAINDKVFEFLRKSPSIKYVVISSTFSHFVSEDSFVLTKNGSILPGKTVALDAMVSTVQRIKALGKTPVIFSPTPQNGQNIGRCLGKASFFGEDMGYCDVKISDFPKRQLDVWNFLKAVENFASVVWLSDFLCSSEGCKASFDDVFVYRDWGHLSSEGSAYLGKKMDFYRLLVNAGGHGG
jgi:peptidoglycan/LPS O-acetylase OafA/YrhL